VLADYSPHHSRRVGASPCGRPPDQRAVHAVAARALGPDLAVRRAREGGSTYVYRVDRGGETFYLRVLPEADATFAPEVQAHRLLAERGARVPAVVYYERYCAHLGLSVMVTTAVAGRSIGRGRPASATLERALREAGRDLALINSLPVAGFGWVVRDGPDGAALAAEHPTYRAFALEGLATDLDLLGRHTLPAAQIAALRAAIDAHDAWLDPPHAVLAHGDYDATHIYAVAGRYSGLIDFGEIRGGDPYYDLAHLSLREGEALPTPLLPLLPLLLRGYAEVTPQPPDVVQRIALASLFIAIKALARRARRVPPTAVPSDPIIPALSRALAALRP